MVQYPLLRILILLIFIDIFLLVINMLGLLLSISLVLKKRELASFIQQFLGDWMMWYPNESGAPRNEVHHLLHILIEPFITEPEVTGLQDCETVQKETHLNNTTTYDFAKAIWVYNIKQNPSPGLSARDSKFTDLKIQKYLYILCLWTSHKAIQERAQILFPGWI